VVSFHEPWESEDVVMSQICNTWTPLEVGPGREGEQKPARSVGDYDLVVGFYYHHSLGDGFSGVAVHYGFLESLRRQLRSREWEHGEVDSVMRFEHRELVPSMEGAMPTPITVWGVLKKLWSIMFPEKGIWSGPPITIPPGGAVTNMRSIAIPAEDVSKIVALCKKHRTTVTAYLAALVGSAISAEHPEAQKLSGGIAVTLRPFAEPSVTKRDMAAYTSSCTVTLRRSSGDLSFFSSPKSDAEGGEDADDERWDVVRRVKEEIHSEAQKRKDRLAFQVKLVGDVKGYFMKKVGKDRGEAFEISNLGVMDFDNLPTPSTYSTVPPRNHDQNPAGSATSKDDAGPSSPPDIGDEHLAHLTGLIFTQSANATSSLYDFSVATIKKGPMCISLSWEAGAVEEHRAVRILWRLQGLLRGGLPNYGEPIRLKSGGVREVTCFQALERDGMAG
jgi:hypothetical protein